MMKTEAPSTASNGGGGGSSSSTSLRSPSPHRNAYEAGIQALKQAKDALSNAANGDEGKDCSKPRPTGRGRRYGSNVHRIKNMFMQMGTVPGEEEDPSKANKEQAVRLSLPRASSLNENVDHSALLKLGATVSERVSRFDGGKADGAGQRGASGFSKLQETRKIFEQRHLQEKQAATNRILLKKERASGFQDGRLDVVVRFNGSNESLDSLDAMGAGEAVSPTVSQLSAVFEKADLRNNLHRPATPRGGAAVLNSKIIAKKSRVFPPATAGQDDAGLPKAPEGPPQSPRTKAGGQKGSSADAPRSGAGAKAEEAKKRRAGSEEGKQRAQDQAEGDAKAGGAGDSGGKDSPEAGSRLVQAEIHASLENGEAAGARKETSDAGSSSIPQCPEGETGSEEGGRAEDEEEGAEPEGSPQGEDMGDESRRDDYSEGDLVDISAYSGVGEDSGGSQLDEDEEDEDEAYEPESGCVEIAGLPDEEEPPPSRKIGFSSNPIKVSAHLGAGGSEGNRGRGQQPISMTGYYVLNSTFSPRRGETITTILWQLKP